MKQHEEENDNLHKADQVYFLYDPQPVRLLDVIYVGPVMIYAGLKGKDLNQFVKWSLIGVGICTILYNGANFFINEKKAAEKRKADKLVKDALKAQEAIEAAIALAEKQKKEEQISSDILHHKKNNVVKDELINVREQPESMSLNGVTLPKEVADLMSLSADDVPAIEKKGRGRPSKPSVEDTETIRKNGRSNIETS